MGLGSLRALVDRPAVTFAGRKIANGAHRERCSRRMLRLRLVKLSKNGSGNVVGAALCKRGVGGLHGYR
jgi:hypothetical protein